MSQNQRSANNTYSQRGIIQQGTCIMHLRCCPIFLKNKPSPCYYWGAYFSLENKARMRWSCCLLLDVLFTWKVKRERKNRDLPSAQLPLTARSPRTCVSRKLGLEAEQGGAWTLSSGRRAGFFFKQDDFNPFLPTNILPALWVLLMSSRGSSRTIYLRSILPFPSTVNTELCGN